jgi:hypothetical protein
MLLRSIVSVIVAAGCSSGPRIHDTSVSDHERAARAEESAAATAEASCVERRGTTPAGALCWKPNDKRFVDAHRAAAAKHRAASAALRDAEATACVGISEDDRDTSPFEHTSDITSVEPYSVEEHLGEAGFATRPAGAVVTFRAVPGLTAEWLQRLVDCHLGRNAALGHVVPEMPACPLVPSGVRAQVRSTGNGFAVEIDGGNPDTARAILARAQRLVAHTTTSQRQ